MGVMLSSLHVVSLAAQGEESFPCSSWGRPQGRQFSTNFSDVSPSHGQQSPLNCCNMGHSSIRRSPSRPGCFRVGYSLHGFPMGSQPPSGIPLLWCGAPLSAVGVSLHPHGPHRAAVAQLPHHGLHHGLQGNLSSNAWSISFPSFLH